MSESDAATANKGSCHTISVVIPAYNAENTVGRAIESVLECNHHGAIVEILVVDDRSTDSTPQKVAQWVDKGCGRVRSVRRLPDHKRGPGTSRNFGVCKSVGEFIAFLDADDVYLPNRFDGVLEYFEVNREVVGVHQFGAVEYRVGDLGVDPDKTRSAESWCGSTIGLLEASGEPLIARLIRGNSWQMNAITIRRDAFLALGGFDERITMGEDLELWIRLATRFRVDPIGHDQPVCVYYRHGDNRSAPNRFEEMVDVLASALRSKTGGELSPNMKIFTRSHAIGWIHDVARDLISRGESRRAISLIHRFVWRMGTSSISTLLLSDYALAFSRAAYGRSLDHHS